MLPLIVTEAWHAEDLSDHIVELAIELLKSRGEDVGRARTEQVVDLVKGKTAPEQPQLHLGIVHLPEHLVDFLEGRELLSYEVLRERSRTDGSAKQLHTRIANPVHVGGERVRAGPAGPPDLILLHVEDQPTSRTLVQYQLENRPNIRHVPDDGAIVQVPHTEVQRWEGLLDLERQRV